MLFWILSAAILSIDFLMMCVFFLSVVNIWGNKKVRLDFRDRSMSNDFNVMLVRYHRAPVRTCVERRSDIFWKA